MTMTVTEEVPYELTRVGVVMRPEPGVASEEDGVLNPGSGRTADGRIWLLPRLVAAGNVSRIGLAELTLDGTRPAGVRRAGVALSPDAYFERSHDHAGVEDPRITWIASLGCYVMAYVAFGPVGPRPALAVSWDLREWQRLGPVHFTYQQDLDMDFNLLANKDVVLFPEVVPGPDGRPSYAMLHRPMWDMRDVFGGGDVVLPRGLDDPRPGIWISYAPAEEVRADLSRLGHVSGHRLVALPAYPFEAAKIGAGPPPLRVEEGWLLIHHGATGDFVSGWEPQADVCYTAGAMLLDASDPSRVLARSAVPLLEPETEEERSGTVPNVVFPTAIERIDGRDYVFYGMGDSAIGVSLLSRSRPGTKIPASPASGKASEGEVRP